MSPRRRMEALGAALLVLVAAREATAQAPQAPPVEVDGVAPAASDDLARLSRRVTTRLSALLSQQCLRNARLGMSVRDRVTGRVLFTKDGDLPLAPASNMKLLTTGALQTLLGPEFTLETEFRAVRRPDADGDVGLLHVVGGGDPSLTVEDLYSSARALAAAGVRHVQAVVADDTYFDDPGRVPSWPARNFAEWYSAPTAALCANFNVVAVQARAPAAGARAQVWVDPFPTFFTVEGQVVGGRGPWSITSELVAPEGGTRIQLLRVTGRVPPGRTERELRAVEDPPLFCAHGVTESLRRVGIEVAEGPRRGRAPDESVVLHAHRSRPLALLVRDMNKESSNVFAETLLRVLGAEILGAPGTREKGLSVVHAYLSSVSSRTAGTRLEDASGLSPSDRLTANVITDLLLAVAADPSTFPEFLVSLPVGGIDGTLRRRLGDSPARRLVRAKTGRINGAITLSGLAVVQSAQPGSPPQEAVFSILVNDYHCPSWSIQEKVDELVQAIVAEATGAPEPRARLDLVQPQGDAGGIPARTPPSEGD